MPYEGMMLTEDKVDMRNNDAHARIHIKNTALYFTPGSTGLCTKVEQDVYLPSVNYKLIQKERGLHAKTRHTGSGTSVLNLPKERAYTLKQTDDGCFYIEAINAAKKVHASTYSWTRLAIGGD